MASGQREECWLARWRQEYGQKSRRVQGSEITAAPSSARSRKVNLGTSQAGEKIYYARQQGRNKNSGTGKVNTSDLSDKSTDTEPRCGPGDLTTLSWNDDRQVFIITLSSQNNDYELPITDFMLMDYRSLIQDLLSVTFADMPTRRGT